MGGRPVYPHPEALPVLHGTCVSKTDFLWEDLSCRAAPRGGKERARKWTRLSRVPVWTDAGCRKLPGPSHPHT